MKKIIIVYGIRGLDKSPLTSFAVAGLYSAFGKHEILPLVSTIANSNSFGEEYP